MLFDLLLVITSTLSTPEKDRIIKLETPAPIAAPATPATVPATPAIVTPQESVTTPKQTDGNSNQSGDGNTGSNQ